MAMMRSWWALSYGPYLQWVDGDEGISVEETVDGGGWSITDIQMWQCVYLIGCPADNDWAWAASIYCYLFIKKYLLNTYHILDTVLATVRKCLDLPKSSDAILERKNYLSVNTILYFLHIYFILSVFFPLEYVLQDVGIFSHSYCF